MRRLNPILAFIAILAWGVSSQPSSFEPAAARESAIKWTNRTIKVSLSSSLSLPAANMAEEADVLGAVQRALHTWEKAANVKFVVVESKLESISPVGQPDGVNLITIAPSPENISIFEDSNNTARTRVFYDRETGAITEADIAVNPFPYSPEGELLQFSTDNSPRTYDLESTLAHEAGHLLGLGHSGVVGATMHAAQGLNGVHGSAAITARSLSDADIAAIRELYGGCENSGTLKGKIHISGQSGLLAAGGAHVWIEDLSSGGVIASSFTTTRGEFRLGCVPEGDYRVMIEHSELLVTEDPGRGKAVGRPRQFRSTEINGNVRVDAAKTTNLNYVLAPPQNSARALQPGFFGANGDLSVVPLLVEPGARLTVYIEGAGVDQVPGNGFVISSPLMIIDASSLTLQQRRGAASVISFDVITAPNILPGDYSIRLQANSGELAYLVGAITVEAPAK